MAGLGGLAGLRGRLGEGPKGLGLSALPAVRCASTSTAARDAPSCPCSPQPCGRQCRKHGLAALASCPCSVQAIMNFAEHVCGAEIRRGVLSVESGVLLPLPLPGSAGARPAACRWTSARHKAKRLSPPRATRHHAPRASGQSAAEAAHLHAEVRGCRLCRLASRLGSALIT